MVDEMIREIKVCLKNGCFMAALTTALTLPDICGKAQYPDEKSTKKRYEKWFNEYIINQFEYFFDNCGVTPFFSSNLIYLLRCSVLHQGNPGVDQEKSDIDYFELIWREKESASSPIFRAELVENESNKSYECKRYSINLRYLCEVICQATENYYNKNKKLFNFFNYNLEVMDFHTRETFGIRSESL